jgi:hypothetical protein
MFNHHHLRIEPLSVVAEEQPDLMLARMLADRYPGIEFGLSDRLDYDQVLVHLKGPSGVPHTCSISTSVILREMAYAWEGDYWRALWWLITIQLDRYIPYTSTLYAEQLPIKWLRWT